MHLTRLRLHNFRSWASLDLQLEPGLTIVSGPNASGKTNLIEAAAMLATLRSPRASREGELIAWQAEPPAVARIEGEAETAQSSVLVEIALAARSGAPQDAAPATQKRIKVNGVQRSASQALGAIRAVAFSGLDAELLTGEAARRRTFLDVTISQVHPAHMATLSRYRQAVQQRNALLRRIAARQASPSELEEWDNLLCSEAGRIWHARAAAADYLTAQAQFRHAQLQGEPAAGHAQQHAENTAGYLTTQARPAQLHGKAAAGHAQLRGEPAAEYAQPRGVDTAGERLEVRYEPALRDVSPTVAEHETERDWSQRMADALEQARPHDLRRAVTTVGPHRDDLAIELNGRSAAAYASRAQQRDAALALRVAQADLIARRSREAPILLLDDLFSELDADRRERAAQFLANAPQIILTTARPETLPTALPPPTAHHQIQNHTLTP